MPMRSEQVGTRLRRLVIVVVAATALIALPTTAGAQTNKPTLTLTPYCFSANGVQYYGAQGSLSGFPPFTPFQGSLRLDATQAGTDATTDASGNYGPVGFAIPVPVDLATATVTWSGGTLTATLARPCRPNPTTEAQCTKHGWATYGFKNQHDCIKFVQTNRSHEQPHDD